jgi:dihydrodipicolinate synthase/N-acetylneuraminate lyase
MDPPPLFGTLAAAVTPLRDRGRALDEDALAPLFGFYRGSGIDGILILGTTGEGILLAAEERRRLAELAVEQAVGLRLIVHCGAQTTAGTVALAAHAAGSGADGVAVIAPPYFPFAPAELLDHFAAAAAACAPLPFFVYEYAARSGYAVPVTVIEKLRERAPNLVGMKVSDAPFGKLEPYLRTGLDVFVGAEAVIAEGLGAGAVGAVSGVAAAFPEAVRAVVADPTPERGEVVKALREALSEFPFQASVKAALGWRGIPVRADVRAPLLPLTVEQIQRLSARLEAIVGGEIEPAGSLSTDL